MTSYFWGNSYFDDAVEKATSELLPGAQEDFAANLDICDQIRSKQVTAKDAMRSLKKRVNHTNPNVQLLALSLIDACVKNGGDHFLVEIASREFMDNLASIIRVPTVNHEVKTKVLRLIQNWAIAFEGKPSLSYVPQLFKALKAEGFTFPPYDPVAANAAMVDSQTAPEWIDSDVCLRCRTAFTMVNRKHHCRNCGQVFDQACSSKSMPLPHFGIMQPVRVCDTCHTKLNKAKKDKPTKADGHHHHHHSRSRSMGAQYHREDADLQRAIQLSLQESGASSAGGHYRPGYVPTPPSPSHWLSSEPPIVNYGTRPAAANQEEEMDPDLRAAIEASLREANAPKASAPVPLETPTDERRPGMRLPDYDLAPVEADTILTFNQTVEDAQAQGGDFSRFPSAHQMYEHANGLRPKLALSLDDTGRKEQLLSEMHDKLSQAVKLYDSLLTQQLERPSWRAQPQHYGAPARSQTADQYQAQYGYAQSAPPAPLASTYGQPQPSYAPSPPVDQLQTNPWSQPDPAHQWHQPAPPQQQPQYAPPPPAPTFQQQPTQVYQPAAPSPVSYFSGPSPSQAPPQSQPYASTSAPVVQSPVSYAAPAQLPSPAPQQAPQAPGLSRHNTLQSAPRQQAYTAPRPASVVAPPPQMQLPVFPTAPTSNPQAYQMFSPPQGFVEQTEKKEAPLISFD